MWSPVGPGSPIAVPTHRVTGVPHARDASQDAGEARRRRPRLHPDRTAGGRRDHRHPGRDRDPGVPELPQGCGEPVGAVGPAQRDHLGLAVGSFVNVVIHRVPLGRSLLRPGSRCPRCDAAIRPWHNVPVLGWLVLRGRCAGCRERISIRYPLVELATAALFVAVTARLGISPALPAYLYLAAVSVALAMIDFDVRRLPDAIVLPSYAVAGLLLVPAVLAHGDWAAVLRSLAAMAALWAFYFVLFFVYPGGMGFGDVQL